MIRFDPVHTSAFFVFEVTIKKNKTDSNTSGIFLNVHRFGIYSQIGAERSVTCLISMCNKCVSMSYCCISTECTLHVKQIRLIFFFFIVLYFPKKKYCVFFYKTYIFETF